MSDALAGLFGLDPDQQRRQLAMAAATPPTFPGAAYGSVPPSPPPSVAPPPMGTPNLGQTSMPPVSSIGPDLGKDVLAGNVAPPRYSDYKPQESTKDHVLRAIFAGMAGFRDPSIGEQIATEPQRRADKAYQNDTGQYSIAFDQGMKQRQAQGVQALQASQIDRNTAYAEKARLPVNPQEGKTPEEVTIHDLMTGENGQARIDPQTQKPYTYLDAYTAVKQASQDVKPDKIVKLSEEDKAITDRLAATGKPDTPANRDAARKELKQREQQPQRSLVGVPQPDGSTKLIEATAGTVLPKGAQTVSQFGQEQKPNAQEEQRKDMATNVNENLDQLETILQKRPDLFGKVAGRLTNLRETIGTDDQDIAALKTIGDMLGRAQTSAHGMRNGQLVEQATQSIVNSYKNGPDAVRAAINAARKSVATFTKDVTDKEQGNRTSAPKGTWNPRTGRYETGGSQTPGSAPGVP